MKAEIKIQYTDGRTVMYEIEKVVEATISQYLNSKLDIRISADEYTVTIKGWPVTIDAEPTAHVQEKGMLPAPSVETQAPENAHVQHQICDGCGCERTPTHEKYCPL